MPSRIKLDRAELSKIVGGNPKWIRAFEEMFTESVVVTPTTLALIQGLAYAAQGLAGDARDAASEAHRAADEARQLIATIEDPAQRIAELESLVAAVQMLALTAGTATDSTVGDFPAVAAAALSAGELVHVYDDAGTTKIVKADGGAALLEAVGWVSSPYSIGQSATVRTVGILGGLSGLTKGEYYYLSGTVPGAVTLTAPSTAGTVAQVIGVAVSATELSFKPQQGILIT